jgi:hypothetical protein
MDNHSGRVDDLAQGGRLRFRQARSHRLDQLLAGGSLLTMANRFACAVQGLTRDMCQARVWLLTL